MKILNVLIFLLVFNTFILLGFLASEITGKVVHERVSGNVTHIVDGDTLDVKTEEIILRVRLLGINTPEKNQPFHDEAEEFLKKYEGKEAELETTGKDKYDRELGYLFYNGELINVEILREGLANLYVYEKDSYYGEVENAEKDARNSNRGIWRKSINYGCLEIVEFQPIDSESENETLILDNTCSMNLEIIIKDEANHIYEKRINANSRLSLTFKDIFNDDGDSLTVRDGSGLLLYYRY